jgi:membrane associated rhomboid family serine protease
MAIEDENPEEEEQQPQITAEEYLALQKKSIRKKSWWGIGIGGFLVVLHLFGFLLLSQLGESALQGLDVEVTWKLLFRSIFFILGLLGLAAGIFGLYYAKSLKLEDIVPTREAVEFLQAGREITPYYTYILLACIGAVLLAQMSVGFDESRALAGLEKEGFFQKGEYWRLLTSAAMHGGLLHIYFNGQALYGIGGLIEYISNRAHLAVVFLLAAIGGGLASVFLSPLGNSVGASGGIMGLIGYLAVYGYRRKQQLPPDFMRSILINLAFIAGIGIVGYQFIDNSAHLGGFLTGTLYGVIQVPWDIKTNPRDAGSIATVAGMISLVAFGAAALLAILRLTENN